MERALRDRINQAIKQVQGLLGESATINQITYPCIVSIENYQETLTEGGWKDTARVSISISLQDILKSPVPPALGNPVLLMPRNRTYRLNAITPTQTTYELELIDITA